MKKRLFIIALALLLTLTLAACGGGSGDSGSEQGIAPPNGASAQTGTSAPANTPPAEPGNTGSGGDTGSLFDWMKSKTYTYDYIQYDEDEPGRLVEGTLMVDGENMCSIVQVTMNGQMNGTVKTLIKDGVTYMIVDSEKMYVNMGSLGSDMMEAGGGISNPSSLPKLGEGQEEIDGKTLRYEAYEQETLGIFSTLKVFYEGGKVYGFTTEGELENPEILGGGTVAYKNTTLIKNAKNSVDKSMFEIPAGYTEQSMTGD